MKILDHIAQEIAEKTTAILGYPISITDKEGYIIGSTDRSRLGIFHRPSLEVLHKNSMVNCEMEEENKILPGVSVPLMFNNKAIGVLGIVGEPAEVETYVQLVKSQVEMMCQEAFRKEMLDLESKMIEVFVQQMILESRDNPERILQFARTLGYNLDLYRACILIDVNVPSMDLLDQKSSEEQYDKFSLSFFQREVLDYLSLIFRESKDDIISAVSMERFIVIKSMKTERESGIFVSGLESKWNKLNKFLQSKYQMSAWISIGNTKKGVDGIAESYRNAAKAMAVGKGTVRDANIIHYNDWLITLELLPKELSPDLQKKLMTIIQPLIEQDNYDVLSSTFLTYCKYSMNLSETARNMYIHRNTIIYRLEKISECTGLVTSNFEHCLLLYMAIRYYGKK
ncbi:CdaR family transcriptional regulator [Brevibacillus sp. B_LB10_24]|uniref:CdaR family transcriptional regulator n=1 Tax=Brevibacillus sp. B_LB10_24 TaxID=3380645 RepID=UPI0038B7C11C